MRLPVGNSPWGPDDASTQLTHLPLWTIFSIPDTQEPPAQMAPSPFQGLHGQASPLGTALPRPGHAIGMHTCRPESGQGAAAKGHLPRNVRGGSGKRRPRDRSIFNGASFNREWHTIKTSCPFTVVFPSRSTREKLPG